MGIDITQWRIEIGKYWKYVGRRRHSRGKPQGVQTASATSCNPLLALILVFCLITAPSLLLVAGDVERNPGPPKTTEERPESKVIRTNGVKIAEQISRGRLVDWFAGNLAGKAFIANAQQFTVPGVAPFSQVSQMLGAVESGLKTTDTPEETLKTFIEILQDSPVLEDLTKQLIAEYESYGGTAFQSSSSSSGSSSGAGSSSSTGAGTLIGFTEEKDFIKGNVKQIEGKFASLFVSVQKKLQKRKKGGELRTFLLHLKYHWAASLPQSCSAIDVFEAISLREVCTYINYHLLQQIVKHFKDDDKEMTKNMKEYLEDLSGFKAATKLKDYIAELKLKNSSVGDGSYTPQTNEDFIALTAKLEVKVRDYSLKYLDELWESLQIHLNLPELSFLLKHVQDGCVCVTWNFPAELAPQSMRLIYRCVNFFQKQPILWVEIDNICVYIGKSADSEGEMILTQKTIQWATSLGLSSKEKKVLTTELALVSGMEDPADPTLHLRNLKKQLRGITEKWQVLGLSFTFGLQKLSIIDCEPHEVEEQKQQLLEQWLDEDLTASWQKLVTALKNMPLPVSSLAENVVSGYPILKREETEEKRVCEQLDYQVRMQKVVTREAVGSIEQDRELGELSQDLQSMLTERIKKSQHRLNMSVNALKEEATKGKQYWEEEKQAETRLEQHIKRQIHQLVSLSDAKTRRCADLVEHFSKLIVLSKDLEMQSDEIKKLQEQLSKKESYKEELPYRIHRLTRLRSDYAYELTHILDQLEECKIILGYSFQSAKHNMSENEKAHQSCIMTMASCKKQLEILKDHMEKEQQSLKTYTHTKTHELVRWTTILGVIIGAGIGAVAASIGLAVFTGGISLLFGAGAAAGTVGAGVYLHQYRSKCQSTVETCRQSVVLYSSRTGNINISLQNLEVC